MLFHIVGGASSELGSSASSPEMVKVLPGACESGMGPGLGSGLGSGLGLVASPFQAEEYQPSAPEPVWPYAKTVTA